MGRDGEKRLMKNQFVPASTWTIPLVFAVLYALWPVLGLPRPYYAPETREIFWSRPDGVVLMGWYGRFMMAALVSLPVGGLLARLARRCPESWQKRGPWIAAAGIAGAMVLTAGYEVVRWML